MALKPHQSTTGPFPTDQPQSLPQLLAESRQRDRLFHFNPLQRVAVFVAHLFDERNPAVLRLVEDVIRRARACGRKVGICGQAPSDYPDMTEKLVRWGITSISVNPDVIDATRKIVASAETRMLLKRAREK